MSQSVGQIDLDLGINYNQFNQQLAGVSSTAEGLVSSSFKKLGGFIAAAFSIRELALFTKQCLNLGSSLTEVQNVVNVTFGSMASQIDDFSKRALNSFGLSELSAKTFTSRLGAMLKSSGLVGQNLVNMSEGLTALSGNLASFYNISQQDAYDKIRSGLAGMIEPLRQLGINMSIANLQLFAQKQGLTGSVDKMSQANQMMLRYQYLMSVSKDAQGDFIRTQNTWANQTRLLTENWKAFEMTMGQAFINILTPVLRGLNTLMKVLETAAAYFKAFTVMLFGDASAGATVKTSTDAAGASMAGLGDAATGTADKTAKAAKKVQQSLAPFDQLNLLTHTKDTDKDTDAGANAGSVPPVDFGSAAKGKVDFGIDPKVLQPFKDMLDKLKSISFAPLIASFHGLLDAIKPFTKTLFSALQWFYENVLVPLAKWTIEKVLPAFLDVLAGCFRVLNPLLIGAKPVFQWLWNNFLVPIAKWTGGVIVTVLEAIAKALNAIGSWMSSHEGVVTVMTGIVTAFFAAWKVTQLLAFIQMSGGLVACIAKIAGAIWAATGAKLVDAAETIYLTGLYAKDLIVSLATSGGAWIANTAKIVAHTVAQGLATAATAAWSAVCTIATGVTTAFGAAVAFLTSPIGLVCLAIAGLIAAGILLYKNWDTVKAVAEKVWGGIQKIFQNFDTWLGSVFKVDWSKHFGALGDIMNGVISTMKSIWNGLKLTFQGIINFITGVFSGNWKKAWLGVKQIFWGVVSTFGAVMKAPINGIISLINGAITGLNKIKVPDWVPKIGGSGINIPKIPYLAKGGLVSSPTLAMVGDNPRASVDPEVVSPLSKLEEIMSRNGNNQEILSLLQKICDLIKDQQGDIVIKVGDYEFGRAAIKAIYRLQRQTGATLLTT